MRMAVAVMLVAALLGAAPGRAQEPAAEPRRIFEDHGTFGDTGVEGAETVWFTLWEPHIRFRVGPEPEAKLQELEALIRRANAAMRSVSLRYDAAGGRFDARSGTLIYPLCDLMLDHLRFEPSRPCGQSAPPPPATPEAALALARAHLTVGDFARARSLLAGIEPLPEPGFRKLLLRTRAQAAEGAGIVAEWLSPAADRALADALADYRALEALEPDDVEIQFSIGALLLDLGGYAEAREIYDRILARWPDEEYRVAVRIGALHRARGDYGKALEALDRLVVRRGPQRGMRFHYHRGWTLSLLGRLNEAIREYDEGLTEQPDYSSAYFRRACARASLGRLREALADVDEARRLYETLPGAATSKLIQDGIREAAALRAALEAAAASGGGPVANGCTGPSWRQHETPRPRSPMLPQR